MKIALVVPGGVDRSGEVRIIPALLAFIQRIAKYHSLHVFAMRQEPEPATWPLLGATIHNIGQGPTPAALRALRWILAENRNAPFDILHAFFGGRCGAVAVVAGALLRLPAVVHIAGGELTALPDINYGGMLSLKGRILQRSLLRRASRVTAASDSILRLIARENVRGERIPLGVDIASWPLLPPRRRVDGSTLRLLHVASLNAVKDQTTLLRALALLRQSGRDFHLDVVGEDTLNGRIQNLARELGLAGNTDFHGFLTQPQLRPLAESAHVFLMTSRHEAGPVAVLEAAVCGIPTVGTAVGHVAEWSSSASIAVPCQDHVALAHAIMAVMDNEDLRLELARNAQSIAAAEDADHTSARFLNLYEQLIHGASSGPGH